MCGIGKEDKMKIGVIGSGRIVQRFFGECEAVDEMTIVAMYHPRSSSAQFFLERNGIEGIFVTDDLEEFFHAVDAVYVAAPHEFHFSYVQKALEAKKHVLCEKPMVMKKEQGTFLFELAKKKDVVLMEAIKTASCPGFLYALQLLQQGVIGQVYDVEACFTKIGASAGREIWGEHPGSFAELGSYPLLPVVKLFGTNSQKSYVWSASAVRGADAYTKMMLVYPKGCATLKTGLGVKSEGELIVAGESGYLKIPAPWWLTKQIEIHHENSSRVEVYQTEFEGAGLRYELEVFQKRILGETVEANSYVTPEESIWMASQMEEFLQTRDVVATKELCKNEKSPKIWAHRGCSMRYPENTLLAFEKAAQISGITGIEFDVHLSKDGEIVVIHDETVNRTTTSQGNVRDYTVEELQNMCITPSGCDEPCDMEGKIYIPTLREVFELLKPYCQKNHLMLNIELKTNIYWYPGIEEKVIDLVAEYELEDYIVYSSFRHESIGVVKKINPAAITATLAPDFYDCLEGARKYKAEGVHPCNIGMPINEDRITELRKSNIPVRMWNGEEPLFGQSRELKATDLDKYVLLGATDIFTNTPDMYLGTELLS